MICRECKEKVVTYRPTGTNGVRRAIRHPESAYSAGGYQCPGSFGPVDDETTIARDEQRTRRWHGDVPQTADINDYLREKGEL